MDYKSPRSSIRGISPEVVIMPASKMYFDRQSSSAICPRIWQEGIAGGGQGRVLGDAECGG